MLDRRLQILIDDARFRRLEAAWHGLRYLVMSVDAAPLVQIRVLNVSKRRLEEERKREWQLDAAEDLEPRHAHAARGVGHVAVDPVDAVVGVRQHRTRREHGERRHVVREADPEHGQEDGDQQDARQRATEDRRADRDRRPAVQMAERSPLRIAMVGTVSVRGSGNWSAAVRRSPFASRRRCRRRAAAP